MENNYIDITCMFASGIKDYGVSATQLKDSIESIITLAECGLTDMIPEYILCETKKSTLLLVFKDEKYRSILTSSKSRSGKVVDDNLDLLVDVYKMFNDRLVTGVSVNAGVKHIVIHKVPETVDIEADDFNGDDYVEFYEQNDFTTEFTDNLELAKMYITTDEPSHKLQGLDFSDLDVVEKDLLLRLCEYHAVQITVGATINFTATALSGNNIDDYITTFKKLKAD